MEKGEKEEERGQNFLFFVIIFIFVLSSFPSPQKGEYHPSLLLHTLPDKKNEDLSSFFCFRTRLETAIVEKEKKEDAGEKQKETEEGDGEKEKEKEEQKKEDGEERVGEGGGRELSGKYRGDVRGGVGEVRVGVRLDALYNVAQFLFPEKKSRKDRQRLQNAKKHLDIQEEEERFV